LFVGRVSGLLIRDCPFGFLYNQNNNNYSWLVKSLDKFQDKTEPDGNICPDLGHAKKKMLDGIPTLLFYN
jgi:hypothetical protein